MEWKRVPQFCGRGNEGISHSRGAREGNFDVGGMIVTRG